MMLPEKFLATMKEMLGEEFPEYMNSMEEPAQASLRINTNKISIEHFKKISPFPLEQVPWTAKGFYFDGSKVQPAKHPYYYAGLYYIQEASAMIPASLLPVHRGDKLLDLCAAPGGKATELAAKLENTGLLVANDLSASRAMALARNLQMAGSRNTVVTVEEPGHLAESLPEYFDGILVDAPCSGEGMFRRDGHMVQDWVEHGPAYYAKIQQNILTAAYQMLRLGGMMVYSTCTFSPMEDEGMVAWFLGTFPNMRVCPVKWQKGFSDGVPAWGEKGLASVQGLQYDDCEEMDDGTLHSDRSEDRSAMKERIDSLKHCVRIFPHRTRGEGHFAVLMQKDGENEPPISLRDESIRIISTKKDNESISTSHRKKGKRTRQVKKSHSQGEIIEMNMEKMQEIEDILTLFQKDSPQTLVMTKKKRTYSILSTRMADLTRFRQISSGVIVGEMKKNHFERSHQLALAMNPEEVEAVSLPASDERVQRFLRGETLFMEEYPIKGYVLFCVDGFALGWCKGDGKGKFKNKIYPGWRMEGSS